MNTLNFVRKIVDDLQKEKGWLECDIDDLRDFICISCWSKEQLNHIHLEMLKSATGLNRQYIVVSHNKLESSHLLLVAKG